jgi:ATP-binding cassette, subfamily G (WHITE), eye pigment precursor transporter
LCLKCNGNDDANYSLIVQKPLYIPGITYYDMLHYAVQLKLQPKEGIPMKEFIDKRTEELIDLLQLSSCRNRVIPTYPELRGELGCDIRRLSIALEIVDLPPLIIVEEPTLSFDPAMSTSILNCLHNIASKGHIVLCSMTKPFFQEFAMLDKVIVVSDGFSIYSSAPSNIQSYFCNREMGYHYRTGTDLVEFVLDIASGVERPTTQRTADLPHIMQEKFESSDLFDCSLVANSERACTAFCPEFFKLFGYGRFDHWRFAGKRIITVIKRAIFTKFKDWEANRKQIGLCTLIGLACGYLQFQQGAYGKYCLSLLNFPYANTANLTSLIFFIAAITWTVPWLNGQVAIQKLQVYRYEQKSGVCTAFAFILATLISEVPASVGVILIFLNIVYFMAGMGTGADNYFFFMITGCMMTLCGLFSTYLFSAICKKELVLRDSFVVLITLVALMSGFPFQIPVMADYLVILTKLNPARWVFEALMNWKFNHYVDGEEWLKTYGQGTFDHKDIYYILGNILWITGVLVIIVLQKEPILLHRKSTQSTSAGPYSGNRDSVGSVGSDGDSLPPPNLPRKNTRQSEAVQPVLFMRESSVTGRKSQLSVNLSQVGEENTDRGPTVMFKDITYRVADPRHPTGHKTVLNRVSGQFDWGKLSMITGGAGCGKTTLLHVLGGDVAIGAQVDGEIMFNNRPVRTDQPLWQRCGFVAAQNELHRDLTVSQILTYAAKLRCLNSAGYSVVDENIKRTVEILQLEE